MQATERVSLVDLVHDVAARPRRVTVEVDVCPGDAATVVADAAALRRALDHVVANASRHAAGRVRMTLDPVAGAAAVHVDDDGPGIPQDQRAIVMRRFVRLDEGRGRDAGVTLTLPTAPVS